MIDFLVGHRMSVIFAFAAAVVALMIWRSLSNMHKNRDVDFDLRDLLMENGKVSKAACVMMGAFAATTWQFIYYTLNGKMTEGYLGIYVAAWIAPVVARLVSNNGGQPTTVTATTETTTTIKTPARKR